MEILLDPLNDFESSICREWLTTNGLGGYASSTLLGINTRKYHGLLVVPFDDPPHQRRMLLSNIDMSLGNLRTLHFSSNEYPGVIHPDGYLHLKKFQMDPYPTFSYSWQDVFVTRTIFMPHHKNAVILNFRITSPTQESTKVQIYPFIDLRDIHSLTSFGAVRFKERYAEKKIEIAEASSDVTFLALGSDLMTYVSSKSSLEEKWYRNFIYREERERGYPYMGDSYCPGHFEMEMNAESIEFNMLAAGGPETERIFDGLFSEEPRDFHKLREENTKRLDTLSEIFGLEGDLRHLGWAADSFLVDKKVVAGYHWFECWGRDSLVSLPGLTLVTGRYREARRILLDLAGRLRKGLVPNVFNGGNADYNCLDASLFYIYALHKYMSYTDDLDLARRLWKAGLEIVDNCVRGVNDGIKVEKDGLVWSERGTWMDARIDGELVTPRRGKAVELEALWYNALRSMEIIGDQIGRIFPFRLLADKARSSFIESFWNEEEACLFDVVAEGKDPRIRPNQIFAVSLPFPVIDDIYRARIVKTVEEKLLTPYGLRSLAQDELEYHGRCCGNLIERDLTYHQGTVWSWLMGPFVTAFLRVGGEKSRALIFLERLVNDHLREAGIGTISEIFDGDPPHLPRGCISQAWSVAEVLRCYMEDIREIRPPFEDIYGMT